MFSSGQRVAAIIVLAAVASVTAGCHASSDSLSAQTTPGVGTFRLERVATPSGLPASVLHGRHVNARHPLIMLRASWQLATELNGCELQLFINHGDLRAVGGAGVGVVAGGAIGEDAAAALYAPKLNGLDPSLATGHRGSDWVWHSGGRDGSLVVGFVGTPTIPSAYTLSQVAVGMIRICDGHVQGFTKFQRA